uniref:(northern house mosquito) hypothetical protein n=1 Tax=Culex pipiens TaxID=7175 RepID=A0A8D8G7S8_CULPI
MSSVLTLTALHTNVGVTLIVAMLRSPSLERCIELTACAPIAAGVILIFGMSSSVGLVAEAYFMYECSDFLRSATCELIVCTFSRTSGASGSDPSSNFCKQCRISFARSFM